MRKMACNTMPCSVRPIRWRPQQTPAPVLLTGPDARTGTALANFYAYTKAVGAAPLVVPFTL